MKTRLSLCIGLIPTLLVCSLRAEEKFADEGTVTDAVFALAEKYFAEFQHPETGVLYGGRLEGRSKWTSSAEILAEKPHPWGWLPYRGYLTTQRPRPGRPARRQQRPARSLPAGRDSPMLRRPEADRLPSRKPSDPRKGLVVIKADFFTVIALNSPKKIGLS